jgi:hypothetical protein
MTDTKRKLLDLRSTGKLGLNPEQITDAQGEILVKLFELQDHLAGQDNSIGQILEQTTLHNGRLGDVEEWIAEKNDKEQKQKDAEALREGVRNALKLPFRLGWKYLAGLIAIVIAGSTVKDFFEFLLELLHHWLHL